MNNRLIYLILVLLFASPLKSQTGVNFGIDAAPLDLKLHLTIPTNSKLIIGIEAEGGFNFTDYTFLAGPHFAEDKTLIKYGVRDRWDNEAYSGLLSGGVFTRIRNETKFPIDIGYRAEVFIHSDDSSNNLGGGIFHGVYTNLFLPRDFKMKDEKVKRKFSVGLRITAGRFAEPALREYGMRLNGWVRFFINSNKKNSQPNSIESGMEIKN